MTLEELNAYLQGAPLVSRDKEHDLLAHGLRAGELRFLTGPPSAGKTVLVQQLLDTDLGRPAHLVDAQWYTEADALADLARIFAPPAHTRTELEQLLSANGPLALLIDDAEAFLGRDWSGDFLGWLSALPSRTNGSVSVLLVGQAGLARYVSLYHPESHVPLGALSDASLGLLLGEAATVLTPAQRARLFKLSRYTPMLPLFLGSVAGSQELNEDQVERLLGLPEELQKIRNEFVPIDSALRETTMALYERVDRLWQYGGPSHILAPYPIVVARSSPPSQLDTYTLQAALLRSPDSRAAFAYRGDLPEEVAQELQALRASGHPIMPLPERWMQSTLTEENPAGLLRAHERRYFSGQNLFFQSNSITDQGLFFGRLSLLNTLGDALRRQNSILLTGQRKIGKTSTLHMLRQQRVDAPWCWIDFQAFSPDEDWRCAIFTEIVRAVDRWAASVVPHNHAWDHAPAAPATTAALDAAMAPRRAQLAGLGLCQQVFLVLDEVERILPTASRPERTRPFVDAVAPLRALAQGPDRWLTIIAADLRPSVNRINALPGGETNPLYRFFQERPLALFSPEETQQMIGSIAALMGAEVEDGVAAEIHQRTGGHPYLSRVLAGHAFEARSGSRLDAAALERGLEEADRRWELGDFFEQNVWEMLTGDEQTVILHVAQRRQPAHARPPKELAISTGRWRRAVRDLQDQGLLSPAGELAIAGFVEWLDDEGLLQQTA